MNASIGPFVSFDEASALTGWSLSTIYRLTVEGELVTRNPLRVVATGEMPDVFVSIEAAMALSGVPRCTLYRRIVYDQWPIQRLSQPDQTPPTILVSLRALPMGRYALALHLYLYPALKARGASVGMDDLSKLLYVEARRRVAVLHEAAPIFALPHGMRDLALDTFCREREMRVRTLRNWRMAERYLVALCLGEWID